jgi:hypothetical protein
MLSSDDELIESSGRYCLLFFTLSLLFCVSHVICSDLKFKPEYALWISYGLYISAVLAFVFLIKGIAVFWDSCTSGHDRPSDL